jgi:hypothetical protein
MGNFIEKLNLNIFRLLIIYLKLIYNILFTNLYLSL